METLHCSCKMTSVWMRSPHLAQSSGSSTCLCVSPYAMSRLRHPGPLVLPCSQVFIYLLQGFWKSAALEWGSRQRGAAALEVCVTWAWSPEGSDISTL